MVGRTGRSPFVGREAELATLLARLAAAGRGEGGIMLVAGEPGIGKSRLLAEFGRRAEAAGWCVLRGRAYETAGMPPYLPFVEALRAYLLACPIEGLRDAFGRGAADLARLLPELRDALPELPEPVVTSPEADRYRLFDGVAGFLLALAREPDGAGLLLLLDDLHWADTSTLLLLEHIARRLADSHALLVAAHRSTESEVGRPLADLLAGLRRERLAETLPLAPLAPQETAALVQGMAGTVPAPAVAAAIHRRAEGNPFFVEEVVQQLQGEGRDLTDAALAAAGWRAPEGVRQVIGARLARLGADARQLLAAAVVLDDAAPIDLLGAIAGMAPDVLLDALEEATRAGMLREQGDVYQFAHALTRQTVADSIGLGRRQWLHLRAAEAIASLRGDDLARHVAALAAHYQQAGPTADRETTIRYLLLTAEAAAAAFAWEEAVAWWQKALALVPPGDEARRCALLLALGDTQQNAGDSRDARRTFQDAADLARRTATPAHLAQAALGFALTVILPLGSVQQAAVALLEEALGALDEGDSPLRVRVLAQLAWLQMSTSRWEHWGALSERAVAMARRLGDPPTLAFVLDRHYWAVAAGDAGALDARRALIAELRALAEHTADPTVLLDTYQFELVVALEAGDAAAAERAIERYDTLAQRLHTAFGLERALQLRATRALMMGQLANAEELIGEAAALRERMQNPGVVRSVVITLQQQLLQLYQGRAGEAAAAMSEPPATGPFQGNIPRSRRAHLLARAGRLEEARACFDQVAAHDFADLHRFGSEVLILAQLAETCALLGDARRAILLYRRLLPYRARGVAAETGTDFLGAVDHYLGLLAATRLRAGGPTTGATGAGGPAVHGTGPADAVDWDTAIGHFEAALAFHARMGARLWVAYSQADYAALLRDRRRPEDVHRARELLDEAVATFTDLGIEHAAAGARRLLTTSAWGAVQTTGPIFPDGLSPREVEVLRLIATGKSNAEIAGDLVLSIRTVERHIAAIYGKIGARGTAARAAATHYALSRNLLAPDN
jgi:DNA-binding CsgD family transcriptional regulator